MGLSQQHALTWLEGLPQGMSAMQASEKRQGSADWADKQLWEPWLSTCIPVAVVPHNRHTVSPFLKNIFAVLEFFFFFFLLAVDVFQTLTISFYHLLGFVSLLFKNQPSICHFTEGTILSIFSLPWFSAVLLKYN